MVGAVGVELLWNGGSAVGVSSSEFTRGGGDVLRVRGRERARGRVDCDAGSPGVLRRAQDGSQGCCSARATAAARWQPRGGSGRRGEGRGHQREGVVGPGFNGVTCGAAAKLDLACGRPRAAGGRRTAPAAKQSRRADRGRRQGPKRNFQNFRDLSVKQG